MLNLFLAILLGKFEEVQSHLLKKEKLANFEELYKLSSSENLNNNENESSEIFSNFPETKNENMAEMQKEW